MPLRSEAEKGSAVGLQRRSQRGGAIRFAGWGYLVRSLASLLTLALAASAILSCGPFRRSGEDYVRLTGVESKRAEGIAGDYWRAYADGDVGVQARLTLGDKASTWAQRWRSAYPAFFDSTAGKVVYKHGYFLTGASDTAVVEVEVPWVTCRAPVHTGRPDRYFLRLVRIGQDWKIESIWSEPC